MQDQNQNTSPIVPEQPEVNPPLRRRWPVLIVLCAVIFLIAMANLVSLVNRNKNVPKSSLPTRPVTANPQQVSNYENQQIAEARRDAEVQRRQQEIADQLQQLQAEEATPNPEADSIAPMTSAQRAAIYGDSPNAPKQVSGASEAQAEARQRQLAKERQYEQGVNSDTLAVEFDQLPAEKQTAKAENVPSDTNTSAATAVPPSSLEEVAPQSSREEVPAQPLGQQGNSPNLQQQVTAGTQGPASNKSEPKDAALRAYDWDQYQGPLYRVFEGTVFEGVVTNYADGGHAGPLLVMLTTDYYSHDHQQLLLPQGTRLIGNIEAVSSEQQRKMFVVFHRAITPDGFSVSLDRFMGLDPLGTTGLASHVDHGYLPAFAAAAAIGGIGGLAQIGNGGIGVYGGDPSAAIRNGITAQSGQEAEQILNHFLNRLPVITLKNGTRARVYIARDILVPSYANHRVVPNI